MENTNPKVDPTVKDTVDLKECPLANEANAAHTHEHHEAVLSNEGVRELTPEEVQKLKAMRKRGYKRGAYAVMLLLMIFGFVSQYNVANTGVPVHELVATGLFVLVLLHVLKNYKFFGRLTGRPTGAPKTAPSLYKNPFFVYSNIVTLLLIGSFLVMAVTGMFMSKNIFGGIIAFLGIPYPPPNRLVHGLFAYILFPVLCLHLGTHIMKLFSFIERNVNKGLSNVTKLGLAILGVHGLFCLFVYDFSPKFEFVRSRPFNLQSDTISHWFFIVDIVSMGAFFVMLSYTISQFLIKSHAKKLKAEAEKKKAELASAKLSNEA